MKTDTSKKTQQKHLTLKDLCNFLNAKTLKEQIKIIISHSKKNFENLKRSKMSNFIQEILNKLKENEKELLINKSGSTKTSSNEKIRSGQSYLYKIHGMESEVFEVRFKKTISGSILNRALNETMVRYPYFNTKLLEKDGDFYIVQNELSLIAKKLKNCTILEVLIVDIIYLTLPIIIVQFTFLFITRFAMEEA